VQRLDSCHDVHNSCESLKTICFGSNLIKLTLTRPRPFFGQNPFKIATFVVFTHLEKQKLDIFLESNYRILYFTCLRSCSKIFIKFDHVDWKIVAFKVGQKVFFSKKMFRLPKKKDCPQFSHH